MKRGLLLLPVVGLLVLGAQANALTITVDSITKNAGNTANFLQDDLTNGRQFNSVVQTNNAGGTVADLIGSQTTAQTKYGAITAADAGAFTGTSQSGTSDYSVTFTVSAPLGWFYDLVIDTSRVGAMTNVNDGGNAATAALGAVTGTLDGLGNAGLGLAALANVSNTNGANVAVNQSNSLTIPALTGSNTFTLRFTWTQSANSPSGGLNITGPDEAAVRLGVAGGVSGTTADDYPGVGSRNVNTDGHFVNLKATNIAYVPEPGTLLLLGSGLAGLAFSGRRRAD